MAQSTTFLTTDDSDELHSINADKRHTFGNYTHYPHVYESTTSSHLDSHLSTLLARLSLPPRRRTWPEDNNEAGIETQATVFQQPSMNFAAPALTFGVTTLLDPTPPVSPAIEVSIVTEEPSVTALSQSIVTEISPQLPLRPPRLEHLSFVSSMSFASNDSLPSTRQITPPILDYFSSHSHERADMTEPLPSPTPQSPHAIPWFLREEFSVSTPRLSSILPGFRTSALIEVDVEVCNACMLARGEESCTCCWPDLMFSSESDSDSSVSRESGRSGVKIGCLRLLGQKLLRGASQMRRAVGVKKWKSKRGRRVNKPKEMDVARWHSSS